jgi:hypothetical protein
MKVVRGPISLRGVKFPPTAELSFGTQPDGRSAYGLPRFRHITDRVRPSRASSVSEVHSVILDAAARSPGRSRTSEHRVRLQSCVTD